MRALVIVNIIELVAHAHARSTPIKWLLARSLAEAVERDLLVAYLVIDICDQNYVYYIRIFVKSLSLSTLR